MPTLNAKPLVTLTSVLLLNGCASAPALSQAPDPFYPTCETICYLDKPDTPAAVWQDVKNMVVVMEQISATLPEHKQPIFGACAVCPGK